MTARGSRFVALAGLAALAWLCGWPPSALGLVGALPPLALLVAGALAASRWAIATAIVMLPYFSYAVMEILVNPAGRGRAVAFAALTIAVFLAALDSLRRR